ncbi:MerR HTH family regulatory protein [Roseivivax lentus]|uniref:MerR HTH family regulatory protein n=1 Tax=Roseivivax lentus TaxID=633194 RepID=A0A1N7MNR8_9RHOB|nr:MerR family transcriptional regulator [Roseivivax lentus]SIS87648.1 MerR HTH family regulatory protein [Roseivivax lentus]
MSKSPDAFRTISEVADWLDTPAHVLRFWESKFPQVKPVKRAGGRRYYRPADMVLLGGIKKLLHDDGLTIKGVQKYLSEHGVKAVSALAPPIEDGAEDDRNAPIEATAQEDAALGDAPARIEEDSAVEEAETAEIDAAEEEADAPFIEAEPPASTVVPFTGGTLAETPGRAEDAPADEEEAAPAARDTAAQDAATDEAAGIVEAPLPEADTDMAGIDLPAPGSPDQNTQDDAALAEASASAPEADIDRLISETLRDKDSVEAAATDAADEAGPAKEVRPAAPDAAEDDAQQPSLFGTTPEFLAKPFSDRAPSDEAPDRAADEDTAPEETPEPAASQDAEPAPKAPLATPRPDPDAPLPHGPLHHLAGISRLSPAMAARIAPHAAALRDHLGRGA